MPLSAGTRLGPYEIVAPIGAGGMGEVYKARDTRLDRLVAIKISAAEFSERFAREARAVAALNHPHICILHDVGPNYLVMEYLEGETLAERLKRGALPVAQALKLAIEMADAFDCAHGKGIVHRDLKPGNVMITRSGSKLLDFGLAKTEPPAPKEADETVAIALTAPHTILGTLQYMAPEQLQGEPADARSDIFAFGSLLYEMLTGRAAFGKGKPASIIASIMSSRPEPLVAPIPILLRQIVDTCLAKEPEGRFQSALDLKHALSWCSSEEIVAAPAVALTPPRRSWLGWAVAALATAAAAVVTVAHLREKPPLAAMVKFAVPAPEGSAIGLPVLSPDGTRLAFAVRTRGTAQVWVRQIGSTGARPLAGTEGVSQTMTWSPDGRYLAFGLRGRLQKINADGGPLQTICDEGNPMGLSWGRDGTILLGRLLDTIYRVPASGGEPRPLTELDRSHKETRHYFPFVLPDGEHFLYVITSPLADTQGIWVASMANPRQKRRLTGDLSQAEYAAGHLFFVRGGSLMAQPFDPRRLELQGEAAPVLDKVGYNGTVGFAAFSVSDTGSIATGSVLRQYRLTWVKRSGEALAAFGEPSYYQTVSLSPDGKRVAADGGTDPNPYYEIYLLDPGRNTTTQLTFGAASGNFPKWSPDGSRIAFGSNREGVYNIYEKPAAGNGEEKLLLADDRNKFLTDWSSDGRFLLFSEMEPGNKVQSLWVLPTTGDRKPVPYLDRSSYRRDAYFSPDGRWIAFMGAGGGRPEIFVQAFPSGAGKWQVSTQGGTRPHWRRDGKELFYLNLAGSLMATDIKSGADFQVGIPHLLFETGLRDINQQFDVSPDGQRFVLPTPVTGAEPITVIVNWAAGAKN
jgi:Tol biopolymer transport system component/tRNA A-37 threonylcarbamoyl transferase component Bud32